MAAYALSGSSERVCFMVNILLSLGALCRHRFEVLKRVLND